MAKTIATGYTDTAISGNPTMTVTAGKLNFKADFRPLSEAPGEVILTNVTSPVDQPETMRLSQRKVANVYANTEVDPSAYLPIRQGTATLLECRETWVETDSVDTTYRKLIPVKCGITFTLPAYGNITADQAVGLVLRTLGLTFETGTVTSVGMAALLRGVMMKADL